MNTIENYRRDQSDRINEMVEKWGTQVVFNSAAGQSADYRKKAQDIEERALQTTNKGTQQYLLALAGAEYGRHMAWREFYTTCSRKGYFVEA